MEISWLKDFVTLAQSGVFARAAEKRNVTQPAFTRRIKRLEYALGAELVDRSVHPVVLTAAGEKFLPAAQNMIYEWEKSRAELASDGSKSEIIRIATLQSLAVSYLPGLIKSLYPDGRSPQFQIIADNYAGCIESILSGAADAMICYSHKDIQTGDHVLDGTNKSLGSDRLIPVSTTVNGQAKFTLEDQTIPFLKYSKMSFLGRVTRLILENAVENLPLQLTYEDSIAAALKSAAVEGLGVAWLPQALVKSELLSAQLIDISHGDTAFIVPIDIKIYHGRRTETKSTKRFWDCLNSSGTIA